MNFSNAHPGYPFEGDYPGFREQISGEGQESRSRQLAELADRGGAPQRRLAILERLRQRRDQARYPQVDFVCRDAKPDVQFAGGEIVTSVTAYLDPSVRAVLERSGYLTPQQVGIDTPPQVMRLSNSRTRRVDDLLETIGYLRSLGHPASLNYVLTQAGDGGADVNAVAGGEDDGNLAVGKTVGKPIVAPALPEFPVYAANYPPATCPIVVHVIDGGIPAHLRADHWLRDVARTGGNIDPLDIAPADGVVDTMGGHGSRVAGIVQQVAPHAQIRMSRVADTLGYAMDTDVAAAMLRAADEGAHVINVSLAGAILPDHPPVATAAAVAQIQQRHGDKVVIVAAAGNFATSDATFPASHPGVVSVGGLTARLTPTDWSTRGWVTFSTVAEWVRSTHVADEYLSGAAIAAAAEPWVASTGTSFAAPQIAGAVARICYELGLSPAAAVAQLQQAGLATAEFGMAVQVLPGMP